MTAPVRTRFAPSPTGPLHIGGARTALFVWAYARHHGGQFILRIEDTDPERSERRWEDEILDGFRWLGIDWDEGPDVGGPFGPYRQSERAAMHLGVAAQLRRAGWAYPCFCTRERLDAVREQQQARRETARYDGLCRDLDDETVKRRIDAGETFVLRFRVPEGSTTFQDQIRGRVTFEHAEVDDWVMVRGDGAPTYNLVCVCDDSAMQISHVIRGEEHLVNTPKQILLYQALGEPIPSFAHVPLMLAVGGKKMSKRDGDTALADYRRKGYPVEAVINFLALQGWALDGETEVFSRQQLVEHFDVGVVSKSGSVFDLQKLSWLSEQYVRTESPGQVLDHGLPYLESAGLANAAAVAADRAWFERATETARERITTYSDLPDQLAYLFAADDAVEYDEKALAAATKQGTVHLAAWHAWARERLVEPIDAAALGAATKDWIGESGIKLPQLFQPLRCVLSGKPGGPDLFEIVALLGAARTTARIESGLARLTAAAEPS
ncbi:glutamate--tRNA ligase [Engelhardtia mirabilis]|uniref:glutamate--tRNA ligase n=1 Tax=Engelhardtia mirabilis TaxID=2528011 RepID=UPI003AF393CB